jgi:SAM-dependent methyltransferase
MTRVIMSAVSEVATPDRLEEEFARRGPWLTRYRIGDREYGGHLDYWRDPRLELFAEAFPQVRTVLELGSLEGGHSFELARRPGVERVVAIEGREDNVARADFVRNVLGLDSVRFIVANLEIYPLLPLGRFDVVFCSGLLYHLPKPWLLLREIAQVTDHLFIWTHVASENGTTWRQRARRLLLRPAGYTYQEFGLQDPLSGMSATSYWPTLGGLKRMLSRTGFTDQRLLHTEPEHPHAGPAVTMAASRGSAVRRVFGRLR